MAGSVVNTVKTPLRRSTKLRQNASRCPTQKIFFQCDAAALQSRLFMNYEISFPVIAAALYSLSVILVKLATSDEKLSPTSILVFNNVSM